MPDWVKSLSETIPATPRTLLSEEHLYQSVAVDASFLSEGLPQRKKIAVLSRGIPTHQPIQIVHLVVDLDTQIVEDQWYPENPVNPRISAIHLGQSNPPPFQRPTVRT